MHVASGILSIQVAYCWIRLLPQLKVKRSWIVEDFTGRHGMAQGKVFPINRIWAELNLQLYQGCRPVHPRSRNDECVNKHQPDEKHRICGFHHDSPSADLMATARSSLAATWLPQAAPVFLNLPTSHWDSSTPKSAAENVYFSSRAGLNQSCSDEMAQLGASRRHPT